MTKEWYLTEMKSGIVAFGRMVMMALAVSFAFAGVVWAQEEAYEQEIDPINAVVKLEVRTAKPDVCRPWIMTAGADAPAATKVGDGEQWSPSITVKDPDSAFYSIEVTK